MSRYLDWLHRDEKPEVQRELTRREKISNWWDYHIWHVVICVAAAALAVHLLWSAFSGVKPDYQVAYVGSTALPERTAAALETALSSLGTDANGDGQTVVALRQYIIPDAMAYGYAAEAKLIGDLESCDSSIFLLEDAANFQARYFSLALLDGSLPREGDTSAEGAWVRWGDCPALAALPLDAETAGSQALLADIAVARRGFVTEKTTDYPEACEVLWAAMTRGAIS